MMAALNELLAAWQGLLDSCAPLFTHPSVLLFHQLATAWVLCPGRHTVTALIGFIPPDQRRSHDAYHRLLRTGAWHMFGLWLVLARWMLPLLAPGFVVFLDLDDTLFHKTGRKVDGAGNFRDAVRSTSKRVVYALGLNLVVLTLRVQPPWGGEPLGLPINVRLHRKGGPSLLDLAAEMVVQIEQWFPEHSFRLCADGAYASLAGRGFEHTHITSRMRRDAALFERPSNPRKRKRGRPRKKGRRLPVPPKLAPANRKLWTESTIDIRGRQQRRLLWARPVLWFGVCPDRLVLLVIVRDPDGKQPDDFFFTTDLQRLPCEVASQYAGRWCIEDTFRNTKQFLHGEDPQCWKGKGPERAACLSLWLYSATWTCYIVTQGTATTWNPTPWYPSKTTPSFLDAIATLRRALWAPRISAISDRRSETKKILAVLVDALAHAA